MIELNLVNIALIAICEGGALYAVLATPHWILDKIKEYRSHHG